MRIALIGNIAGVGYIWTKLLRRKGVNADLYLAPWEWRPDWEDDSHETDWVHPYGRPIPSFSFLPPTIRDRVRNISWRLIERLLVRKLLGYDLVNSFTGSLFFSPASIRVFGIERRKPYIACATGSDLTEVAVQAGERGKQMRQFFQQSARTLLLNANMIELSRKLSFQNSEFFPFLIDTEKYSPGVVDKEYGSKKQTLFYMVSRLDWGLLDNAPGRNSTKGNDRFIRAFARYVKENGNAYLVFADKGADREPARQLVSDLGISSQVSIIPEMRKNEFIRHIRMADVVVDQFDIGGFGMGALEAMACAKPVLIYLKDHCVAECYSEYPPILNARTEEEIYEQIKRAMNPKFQNEIGRSAREWILKYHDWNIVGDRLIRLYADVLAKWKQPRGVGESLS